MRRGVRSTGTSCSSVFTFTKYSCSDSATHLSPSVLGKHDRPRRKNSARSVRNLDVYPCVQAYNELSCGSTVEVEVVISRCFSELETCGVVNGDEDETGRAHIREVKSKRTRTMSRAERTIPRIQHEAAETGTTS